MAALARQSIPSASGMLRVNLPPLTKATLTFSVLISIIVAIIRFSAYFALSGSTDKSIDLSSIYVSYLTIVPAVSIVFPWTFLTATFVEQNLFALIIAIATLYYGARYCERVWGSRELAKFLLIVSVIPNVIVFLLYTLAFVITRNTDVEFTTICGGVALQSAFLVAFKQLVPEHTVILFRGIIKIRVKHFPALFLLINTVFGLLGAHVTALLTWSGFFTSWVYLRFYRISNVSSGVEFYSSSSILPPPVTANGLSSPSTAAVGVSGSPHSPHHLATTRGDASDTFSMANFFPDAIAPAVSFVGDRFFSVLVKLHICVPFSQEDIEASNVRNGQFRQRAVAPLPGSVRAEAERRRALALQALDQRLAQGKKESTGLGETNFVPEENQS
ncbi:eukaryotic integral membrane protein-domain-containing protein [Lipomyces kononenkoae]|uniref:Eukaryotic integral membrane protein-domain-containing protein n=1 Tax=Lipomyces kononenkoae TaxID=34357 RepID=A0ACC3T8S8_LIPKO